MLVSEMPANKVSVDDMSAGEMACFHLLRFQQKFRKKEKMDVSQQSNNFKNLEKLLFSSSWSHWTIFKLTSYDPLTILLKTEGLLTRM
jgi:hypothetical protein